MFPVDWNAFTTSSSPHKQKTKCRDLIGVIPERAVWNRAAEWGQEQGSWGQWVADGALSPGAQPLSLWTAIGGQTESKHGMATGLGLWSRPGAGPWSCKKMAEQGQLKLRQGPGSTRSPQIKALEKALYSCHTNLIPSYVSFLNWEHLESTPEREASWCTQDLDICCKKEGGITRFSTKRGEVKGRKKRKEKGKKMQ